MTTTSQQVQGEKTCKAKDITAKRFKSTLEESHESTTLVRGRLHQMTCTTHAYSIAHFWHHDRSLQVDGYAMH